MDGKFDEHRPLGDAKHLGTDVQDAPTQVTWMMIRSGV
jgi:hypothetical protein